MNTEKIVELNMPLIKAIASKFYKVDSKDLWQAGVIGVLNAYKHYRDDRNTKFSTFAYKYIYGEMYKLSLNNNIKISKDIYNVYKKIEECKVALSQKLERIPTNKEISNFLNIPYDLVYEASIYKDSIISIDNEDLGYKCLTVSNDNNIEKLYLKECLNILEPLEKSIIKHRYYNDLTQQETAKVLGLSQVKVSRYEKKSLAKMRSFAAY